MHGDYQNSRPLMKMQPGACEAATRPYKVQHYIMGKYSATYTAVFTISNKKPDKTGKSGVRGQDSGAQR
jgi:hypothetical protein